MRRWIPQLLFAVVTVLAVLAMVASTHTGERVSYFSTPAPGNPAVVKIFRTVVRRTLAEPSFTVDSFIDYQAPDLFRVHFAYPSSLDVIVRGHEVYVPIASTTTGTWWGRSPLPSAVDPYFGPDKALGLLQTLLHADSVARDGNDNFTVTTVMSASSVDSWDPGQVLATLTVYVNDDLISSVVPNLRGWLTIRVSTVSQGKAHVKWERVSKYRSSTSTFGDYGQVTVITAPPFSETVPMILCDGGYGYKIQARGHCINF
jgi:hypothetical protein